MAKKRAFISFDYDNDLDLKTMLVGQSKNEDSPFDIVDMSVKEHLTGDWKEKVKTRIKGCDVVAVICGAKTDTATGVAAELKIAKDENKSYFLLWGRSDKTCVKPVSASSTDTMYKWNWDILKALFNGQR